MSKELEAPNAEQADPTEDTPPAPAEDTAANTPEDTQPDWQKRYKDAQAELTRQAQARRALEDEVLAMRGRQPEPAAPPEDETPRERALREQLEEIEADRAEKEWTAVRTEYGPMVDAYSIFQRGFELDPSPRGILNAYVESIRALAGPAEPEVPKKAKPTRDEATRPITDDNRPAAGSAQADLEQIKAKAVEKKDPGLYVGAQLRRLWGG